MLYEVIFVNHRPIRFWHSASTYTDELFIRNFDPYFHLKTARTIEPHLSKPESESLQLAVRTLQGLAAEAFFALLFAVLQAPRTPLAWLTSYRQEDLKDLTGYVSTKTSFPSKFEIEEFSWHGIAKALLPVSNQDDESQQNFGNFWAQLAQDIQNTNKVSEFNALKHGFRIQPGAPVVEIAGISIPAADSGSSFPVAIKNGKFDLVMSSTSRSWSINSLFGRLELTAWSMANLIAILKLLHGVEPTLELALPTKEEFQCAESPPTQVLDSISFGPSFKSNVDLGPIDQKAALKAYEKRKIRIR